MLIEPIHSRVRLIKNYPGENGNVIYWMSRDQRADDNWALIFASQLAEKKHVPLIVIFCLTENFLGAAYRQYAFMIKGLKETFNKLKEKNIGVTILYGKPEAEIPKFIKKTKSSILVTDFDPLKIKSAWKESVLNKTNIMAYEVDAHNIVPCWVASDKREYGAYTIRPKIRKKLIKYLTDFPEVKKQNKSFYVGDKNFDMDKMFGFVKANKNVSEVDWIKPGFQNASLQLKNFIRNKLSNYAADKNDPSIDGTSNLSIYLHFGQMSAQRAAHDVLKCKSDNKNKDAFLEELIIRRELSDNFCYYCSDYDNVNCFPDWSKKALREAILDKREYLYTLDEFESARTHDDLWNAAQSEMAQKGKMHGYMRMYWAKKILEWTESPEKAMEIAVYLNDKYELDGRDPNGYAGIAWSIGGVHDRAWPGKEIFGKVRYMSYNGCKRKFDISRYINKTNR